MMHSHRQPSSASSCFSILLSRRFRFLLVITCFFVFVTVVLTSASFYIRSIVQRRNAEAVLAQTFGELSPSRLTSTDTRPNGVVVTPAVIDPAAQPAITPASTDVTPTPDSPPSTPAASEDVPHEIHDHGEDTHAEDDNPDSHSHVFDTAHHHFHESPLTPAQTARKQKQEEEAKVMAVKCKKIGDEYGIESGKTWGTATPDIRKQWSADDCDTYLALHSYKDYIVAHPELFQPIVVAADRKPPAPKQSTNPLISVCICTTTRGLTIKSLDELTLFKQLLPSIAETAEEGYEYWVYLLYDVGDKFFDTDDNVRMVEQWFSDHVVKPMMDRKIYGRLILCRYHNEAKKPGPAFNYVTHLAYSDGSDYIYRINDDTYFVSPYTSHFINALQGMGPPYGAVGPLCREGNTYILTHDFVHRVHHEVMQGWHYPPTLTDWWMDDWISRVYGRHRTKRVDEVIVKHMMLSHGTRYSVTWEHSTLVGTEVELGRQKIELWMERHNLTKELDEYQQDEFKFTMHGAGLGPK